MDTPLSRVSSSFGQLDFCGSLVKSYCSARVLQFEGCRELESVYSFDQSPHSVILNPCDHVFEFQKNEKHLCLQRLLMFFVALC